MKEIHRKHISEIADKVMDVDLNIRKGLEVNVFDLINELNNTKISLQAIYDEGCTRKEAHCLNDAISSINIALDTFREVKDIEGEVGVLEDIFLSLIDTIER